MIKFPGRLNLRLSIAQTAFVRVVTPRNKQSYLSQFAAQTIETWQANSSTGKIPTAIKKSVLIATHSFPIPAHLILICQLVIFSSENVKQGHKLELTCLYACCIMHIWHNQRISKWNAKGGQKRLELSMLPKTIKLVDSYCKETNISYSNWLRYLFSSSLPKIWLGVGHHHLANLHDLKT